VAEIPAALTSRLASGGRLAAIVQKTPKSVGKITIATREASGAVACRALNDAKVAYVAGYAPKQEFVF
jgi:protein-L-isoaspartate O-methyltransferase